MSSVEVAFDPRRILSVLVRRARHTRTRHGWGSLTEAELRVLRLAAKGRPSPEIARTLYLSRRTVGWHLSNMFRKLGLSSRGELVVEVRRHDLG
jgi:DNA-binding CsgD family transcriptional regulator